MRTMVARGLCVMLAMVAAVAGLRTTMVGRAGPAQRIAAVSRGTGFFLATLTALPCKRTAGSMSRSSLRGVLMLSDEAAAETSTEVAPAAPERAWEKYLRLAKEEDTEFMQWVYAEKAKEIYEKENPVDTVAVAMERIKGPLSYLPVLVFGFFLIPTLQAIAKALGYDLGGSE